MAKKLRKVKGKVIIAPVARRSKVSQKKGGSDESDEANSDESHSDDRPSKVVVDLSRRSIKKQARSKRLRSKIYIFGFEATSRGVVSKQPIID